MYSFVSGSFACIRLCRVRSHVFVCVGFVRMYSFVSGSFACTAPSDDRSSLLVRVNAPLKCNCRAIATYIESFNADNKPVGYT